MNNNINKKMSKAETQVYRAKKWLGMVLVPTTNKYLKVDLEKSNLEGVYISFNKPKKYQDKFIIEIPNCEKAVFTKQFACMSSTYWDDNAKKFVDYIIFKPYFEDDKTNCLNSSNGADGLFQLASFIKTNPQFRVKKW